MTSDEKKLRTIKFNEYLSKLTESSGLLILDPARYPEEYFLDSVHLNSTGIRRLADDLAELIANKTVS